MRSRPARALLLIAPILTLAACGSTTTTAGGGQRATASASSVDYGDESSWLCLPGREDACAVDQSSTVVMADGTMQREGWRPNPNPEFDCFYIYPTVSQEPTPNSSMTAGPGERGVVASQLARFASECRVFAPLYRQITLAGLRAALGSGATTLGGGGASGDFEMPYQDVLAAWNEYLANRNEGRGIVLIGHSQGSSLLLRLIREEIDGKPIQSRIISAALLGWNVAVPEGRDVGGDFQNMPLCRTASQTQCIVTYVSFRETLPPPPNSLFGRPPAPGMEVACTNPASLSGGSAELESYLSAERARMPSWVEGGPSVTTPFVRVPGLVSGECVRDERGSYLQISIHDDDGLRTNVIGGDVLNPDGTPNAMWGLHLIDVPLAIGDLVELVGVQYQAYRRGVR